MEALASMIALGLIALSVQSLLLLTNRFLSTKRVSFKSLENRIMINNMICNKFSEPIFVQNNPNRIFSFNSDAKTYTQLGGSLQKASLTIPLIGMVDDGNQIIDKLINNTHQIKTALNANLIPDNDPSSDGAGNLKAHINDRSSNFSNLNSGGHSVSGSHNYLSQFYDIYSDTHTLVAFQIDLHGTTNNQTMGKINKGMIFASRCSRTHSYEDPYSWREQNRYGSDFNRYRSIQDSGFLKTGESPEDKEIRAVANTFFVLGNPWRPFYFPSKKNSYAQIQCCNIGVSTSFEDARSESPEVDNCVTVKEAIPVTYAINIESMDVSEMTEDKSMDGYFNNNTNDLSFLKSQSACSNDSGDFEYKKDKCQDKSKELYGKALMEFFTYPIKVTSIYELPMRGLNASSEDRKTVWATAFTADYMAGASSNIVKMNLLSVENKCYSFLPDHLCNKWKRSVHAQAIGSGSKSFLLDYLQTKSYSCPFSYKSIINSGTSIPLGTVVL